MKLSHLVLAELCWPFLANALHIPRTDESAVSNLTSSAYSNGLSTVEEREIQLDARHDKSKCTLKNLAIRREYGSLSRNERLDYVNAVLCLQSLPPRTPANVSSGARSRFDDFTVVHIQQTLDIHFSGVFPPWHRWFVHSYWDWPKYAHAPQDSPIFDGSDTSLGGNGEFIEHQGPVIQSPDG
jgi:tyrosinase